MVTKNIVHQKHGSPKKWLQKVIVLPGTGEYIQIGCQGPVREEKETNSAAQGSFVCRQKTPFLENTNTAQFCKMTPFSKINIFSFIFNQNVRNVQGQRRLCEQIIKWAMDIDIGQRHQA